MRYMEKLIEQKRNRLLLNLCPECENSDILKEEIGIMNINLNYKLEKKIYSRYCKGCMIEQIRNSNKKLKIYLDYYKKLIVDIELAIIKNDEIFN
jgi:hypothetical protein